MSARQPVLSLALRPAHEGCFPGLYLLEGGVCVCVGVIPLMSVSFWRGLVIDI